MTLEFFVRFLESEGDKRGFDWELEIAVAHECAWSAELRITPKPNAPSNRPDESTVLFSAGGYDPEHVTQQLMERAREIVLAIPLPVRRQRKVAAAVQS